MECPKCHSSDTAKLNWGTIGSCHECRNTWEILDGKF